MISLLQAVVTYLMLSRVVEDYTIELNHVRNPLMRPPPEVAPEIIINHAVGPLYK